MIAARLPGVRPARFQAKPSVRLVRQEQSTSADRLMRSEGRARRRCTRRLSAGLAAYEALQRLDSKREYSERKRSLYREAAEAETIQVVRAACIQSPK